MKKVIKLTDSKLNSLIKKVLKEQEEEQIATTGPSPEEISGTPGDDEGGEPNFEAFLSAAEELIGQGLTVGDLVDKICEAQKGGSEESEVEPTEPETEQGIPSDNQ
jgi:hypothetical protein